MSIRTLNKTLLAAMLATGICMPAHAGEAELLQKIEKLAAELEAIKAELAATRNKADKAQSEAKAASETAAQVSRAQVAAANPDNVVEQVAALRQTVQQTRLSSYGEIAYTRPKNASDQAQTDVARVVLGATHRFNEKTKMVAELEVEHAVTSKDDNGEVAVEQAYVEHELQPGLQAKAGLFLMPVGFMNTSHEPTAYFGVHRNFVETAIIPTTWREAGVGLSGQLDNGLSWDAGLTTGFNLNKWDATKTEGRESPLASIHQEGQQAKSRDLSVHGALNYRGIPGVLVGGSVFTGKLGHGTADFPGNDARLTLWEIHGRYNPGKLDVSALFARGSISNTAVLNQTLAGQPAPVPSAFDGWYVQAAYQLWKQGDYTVLPFLRYERFNTAKSYDGLVAGFGVGPLATETVTTLGLSFKITDGVVLKADYQKFNQDNSRDRYNLGVGYSF